MPAIVGFISLGTQSAAESGRAMLRAMSTLGPDGSREDQLAGGYFGTQFFHTLPEDDYDLQPFICVEERFLLAADARVDNRHEIGSALNLPPAKLATLSDSALILHGWERWGPGILDRLLGDIAIAVFDSRSQELFLARTPLSNRPIFYCQGPDFIAFGSLPSALFAIAGVEPVPNLDPMADLLAGGIFCPGSKTMFRGVESVAQGTATILGDGSKKEVRLWSLDIEPSNVTLADAAEAMRAEFDRAVHAQSRRRSGPLAGQLSGGRDSSAVVTSASAQGLESVALTAAPRREFPPIQDTYWLADETDIAAETARLAGIDHVICRSEPIQFNDLLRNAVSKHFQPIGNPVNFPWIKQTYCEARRQGAAVLLTGGCGNFGLSSGGPGFLGEYYRTRGLRKWRKLAHRLNEDGMAWRSLASITFGHLFPQSPYHFLWRLSGRGSQQPFQLPLLRGCMRRQAEQIRRERLGDMRAPASRRKQFAGLLRGLENGDKFSLAGWGVDVRDPTADRRFVELCYSLPVEAFIGADHARPAYSAAFGDRLPQSVIEGRQAGYQAADWFESIRPNEIRTAFQTYSRHPLIDEIVDLPAVDALIDRWPVERGNSIGTYDLYCNQLIGTLALASFIDIHFPA